MRLQIELFLIVVYVYNKYKLNTSPNFKHKNLKNFIFSSVIFYFNINNLIEFEFKSN